MDIPLLRVSYGFVGDLGDLLLGSSYGRVLSGLVLGSFRVRFIKSNSFNSEFKADLVSSLSNSVTIHLGYF